MCDPHTFGLNAPSSVTYGVTSASHAGTRDAAPSSTVQNHISPVNADVSHALRDSATTQTYAFATSRSYQKRIEKLTADCETLSDVDLRRLYPAEVTCWHGMLRREKDGLCIVAPEFRDFRSFLRELGPRPKKGFTVDRVNNDNRTYGPGLVRWADKKTQNNNKSDTNIFIHPKTGKGYTTADLMKRHSRTSAAIRKRKERGWTDEEQIAGRKLPTAHSRPEKDGLSNLVELEDTWVHELDAYFESTGSREPFVPPINGKDKGMLKAIRERTPLGDTAAVIRYAVRNWSTFATKVQVAAGLRSTPSEPRLDFLARYPDIAARFYRDGTNDEQREELGLRSPCRGERARAAREAAAAKEDALQKQNICNVPTSAQPPTAATLSIQPVSLGMRKDAYDQKVASRAGVAPLRTEGETIKSIAEEFDVELRIVPPAGVRANMRRQWEEVRPFVQLEHLSEQQRRDYCKIDPEWFAARATLEETPNVDTTNTANGQSVSCDMKKLCDQLANLWPALKGEQRAINCKSRS